MTHELNAKGQIVLTDKERRFVAAILSGATNKDAAIAAGYAPTNAASSGSNVRKRGHIAAAIEAGLTEAATKAGITREKVTADLELIYQRAVADQSNRSIQAGVNAKFAQAKVLGLIVDKHLDVTTQMTDAQLVDAVSQISPRAAEILAKTLELSAPTTPNPSADKASVHQANSGDHQTPPSVARAPKPEPKH